MLYREILNATTGRGRLHSYIEVGKLGISRTGINRLAKPWCARPDLRFELNRAHTHLVWGDNSLRRHIRYRMPFPNCGSQPITTTYSHQYVTEWTQITPPPQYVKPPVSSTD